MVMADEAFSKELLADQRVTCYRLFNTGSEAADLWYQDVIALFSTWDASNPLLLLVDLSKTGNSLSAEAMRRSREASLQNPNVPGKSAMLIDPNATAYNVNALVEHVLAGQRKRDVFSDEAEAIAWLLQDEP
jgi:hypothetical protein